MNRILYQLAYRHIQKYKKYYIFIAMIVFALILGFITYSIVWDNHYEVEKLYNQEHYGRWYFMAKFDKKDKENLEMLMTTFDTPVEHGYCYEQGFYQNQYKIGYVTDDVYDLCHLKLIEGRYPSSDHEIMISTDIAKAKHLALHQEIELKIQGSQIRNYTIVGIIENAKPLIQEPFQDEKKVMQFFDIYTYFNNKGSIQVVADRELASEITYYQLGYDDFEYNFQNVIFNVYGYSMSGTGQSQYAIQQVIIFIEIICLATFSLSMSMSASLKRRSEEFALLRGIGMTTKQLFWMVLYEIFYLVLILTCIGTLLSFGLSYLIMLYDETQFGYFVCYYHVPKIIGYSFLLMCCIILAFMYPILSSTKNSLTGTFEGKKFQYIQVHYRQLHYQRKWRLALRELEIHKKLSLGLLVICSALVLSYTVDVMKEKMSIETYEYSPSHQLHYFELSTKNEDHLVKIEQLHLSKMIVGRYIEHNQPIIWKDFETYASIYALDNLKLLSECQIEGDIPQNENEIMIRDGFGIYDEEKELLLPLTVGDVININDHDYKIVGKILPNEVDDEGMSFYYLPPVDIYIYPKVYNQIVDESIYNIKVFYETEDEKEKLEYTLNEQVEYGWACSDYDYTSVYNYIYDIDIDYDVITFPCMICFIFCYFLNKNYILNNYQNYALYRLVGMTKKDLLVKEFFKALILSLCILMIQLFWIVMMNISNGGIVIPIIDILLSFIIVLLVLSIVYCLPLHRILKDDFILSIKGKE